MGFPPADPVFVAVTEAYHAMHGLSVRLHSRVRVPDE